LAVGGCVSVEMTKKKTAKQTGARGPLFARAEAVRRDKFSCRRSECGAGASLLSSQRPAAVCLEEADVCDRRSPFEASQISELREKQNLSGDCTDVPGPERHKGESLVEEEDDWSSGCFVAEDDANNDDNANNNDGVNNNDKANNDDNDDNDNVDDNDDNDEFLSMPVLKYFGHLDTWLCGHGWRRRETAENCKEQNVLRIFASVSLELFKLLVPIYGSRRGNFVY
jgi:hypothetical protein